MQASIQGEVQWRLDLYARIFNFCQQGDFSYARFLALVPDRLRLAVGESIERIQVPVLIHPTLRNGWAKLIAWGEQNQQTPIYSSAQGLRRVLRLGQMDPDLDVAALGRWLQSNGNELINSFARLYLKGFKEIGQGEGGEETAYLVHLQVIEAVRQALTAQPTPPGFPQACLLATMVDMALRATLDSEELKHAQLSPRLGLQFAATLSPFAFSLTPFELARRPLNYYRTTAHALQLAQRVIQDPIEIIPLERVVDTLSKRLTMEPQARQALMADAMADMVRDCLMLIVAQEAGGEGGPDLVWLAQIASSSNHLLQHLQNSRRRDHLATVTGGPRFAGSKPAKALSRLLFAAPQVLAGDSAPLGIHGNIEERAKTAAAGAICAVLDERTERLKAELHRIVHYVEPSDEKVMFEQGRCYRLALDDHPLYHLPLKRKEGTLHVDTRELTARLFRTDARSTADFLRRFFYEPVLELVRSLAGPTADNVRLVRVNDDALVLRGDLVALVELALRLRAIVANANQHSDSAASEILGGASGALTEIDEEAGRLEARVETIDGMLRRLKPGEPSIRFLKDERRLLSSRAGQLRRSQHEMVARTKGETLRAGIFVSFGDKAEEIDLPAAGLGAAVSVSRGLLEAALASSRSPALELERRRVEKLAHRMPAGVPMDIPFDVMVRGVADPTDEGLEVTQMFNAGAAISGAALEEYKAERRGVLRFDELELITADLDVEFRKRFVIEGLSHRFVVASRSADSAPVLLFHHSGRLTIGAVDSGVTVAVWEVIRVDSPFAVSLFAYLGGARGH